MVIAVSYCLLGRASLMLAVPPGYATAIWPSAGLALAAALVYGIRVWPAIWLGSLAVNLWVSYEGVAAGDVRVISAAVIIAIGASLQAVVTARLLCKFKIWPNPLQDGKKITRLLVLGGPIGCLINATIGVTALLVLGLIDGSELIFNWLNWWMGDAIGVLVVTPLMLVWSGALGDFWRRRAVTLSAPICVALFAFIALFLFASEREQSRLETRFLETSSNIESATKTKLQTIVAALGGVQSLFASSQHVDANEFQIFSRRALVDNPELLALSWNRQITHAQRPYYENTQDTDQRLRFTERNAQGDLINALEREQYTVVQFIEPLEENRSVLGFDVASSGNRHMAIERARDTGQAAATELLNLVQANKTEQGFLIFTPIYSSVDVPVTLLERREKISGYAVGVVHFRRLIDNSLAGLRLEDISLRLYDGTGIQDEQLLTSWGYSDHTKQLLSATHKIEFAGRQWLLIVGADAEYLALHRAPGMALVLTIGLLLCGILGSFNLTLAGNERREALRAATDVLTELANRGEFERRLGNSIASCKNEGAHHALLYCDLDKFKLVNDTAGHQAGDALLKIVSGILRSHIRSRDTVARLGGDEFGLILEHCQIDKAGEIAEEICADIRNLTFEWNEQTFRIGVSIGVIALTAGTIDLTDAMTRADIACYTAKDQGRNRVYIDRIDRAQVRRRKSELQRVSELRSTLEKDELLLYKQPIWSIDKLQGEPTAVEILLRVRGNEGQVLSPLGIIDIAERYDIMPDIDRWVISRTLQQCKNHINDASQININLSGNSLDGGQLVDFVCGKIKKHSIAPERLCFEISESYAVANLDEATDFMQKLKKIGCRFAIDGFNGSISSFRHLQKLPVDLIKIDGNLVQSISSDPAARAMVMAIQQFADDMNIATAAEWVSDTSLLAALENMGVGHVQGFTLGLPVPIESSSFVCDSNQNVTTLKSA